MGQAVNTPKDLRASDGGMASEAMRQRLRRV